MENCIILYNFNGKNQYPFKFILITVIMTLYKQADYSRNMRIKLFVIYRTFMFLQPVSILETIFYIFYFQRTIIFFYFKKYFL